VTSISFHDVDVSYGRRPALRGFNGSVGPGRWLCLIGPNGAGKSSLLRAIAGTVAHGGRILVDGAPLDRRPARRRAQLIAHVPQNPVVPADMTAREYIALGRNPFVSYFGTESSHDVEMVDDVLDRLDLADLAERHLGTLSGGERQRLVIARGVAQEAPILLLDEPTSALDIGHQQQALELVDRLRREHGLTVISAMHDLTLAGMYSDELVLLHEGNTVASGEAREVLRAETLAEFYGVSVDVRHEDDGQVVVVPRRRRPLG